MTHTLDREKRLHRTTLGQLVDFIDGDRGDNYPTSGEFAKTGHCLFLNTKNVPGDRFDFEEKLFITKDKDSVLRKGKLERGDYVFTTRGTVGNFAYYDWRVSYDNIRINSGMVILRKKSSLLNRDYLRYFLASPIFRQQVQSRVSGSAQPQLPIRNMLSMEIELPSIESQSRIASVLSAYDGLIENNAMRIRILEEMAQRIYTEWFVKFKFPGYETTRMVDSGTEYGMIPEGWQVQTVADLYRTASGGTPSRTRQNDFYRNGTVNWIKTKELNDSYILATEEKITEQAIKESSAKLFPKDTTVIAMYGATIGKLGILSMEASTNQACCAFLPKNKLLSPFYIFQFFKCNINKLIRLGMGAAQPNVSQIVIRHLSIIRPSEDVLMKYNQSISSIFDEILILQRQAVALARARDLLIPQLVTGKRELRGA